MQPLVFNLERPEHYGEVVGLSPRVKRVVAPNAGALTFSGTVTYIIGHQDVVIIDPGSEDDAHFDALLKAVKGKNVAYVLVTHTHSDHTAGAVGLATATGAVLAGCAPHHNYTGTDAAQAPVADAHVDYDYAPDDVLEDGRVLTGKGWTLETIATPGHTANHLCFALREESALFSGDHVMGWSTTVVAPPVGNMRDYMLSLEKLMQRGESRFYPAHGMPVEEPQAYMRQLLAHRQARHEQIRALVGQGLNTPAAILPVLYPELGAHLAPAALMTIAAHLDMVREDG